jgi:hypothetical protein
MSKGEKELHTVADFRRRLELEVKDLPRSERERLLEQINTHLEEAISPVSTAAEIEGALEALGSPEAIAAAARTDGVSGPAAGPNRGLNPRHLAWVALGILAGVLTLILTSLGVVGLGLEAAFLAGALFATAVGRPQTAAPLYVIEACGVLSGIFLFEGLVEPILSVNGPGLASQWPQALVLPVLALIGLFLGVRWLWRTRKTPVKLDLT